MATLVQDHEVTITDSSYGKTGVKLLFVRRGIKRHEITEYEVSTLLQLNDHKDYMRGDNRGVVPTDTQKNTVYVVAQKYGVGCPEEFAMSLCRHFLFMYDHVVSARVRVETVNGWTRMNRDGKEHNHAFVSTPQCVRYAEVFHRRAAAPQVSAGLSGLRVLKTTQSAFVDFHRCAYTTLPDAQDRILSTVVKANWLYDSVSGVNFDNAWESVVDSILQMFGGPAEEGLFSPSVQLTLYDTQKLVLSRIKQISQVSMSLPNVHYFDVDMNRFKDSSLRNTKNVYLPTDKPSGLISATLTRKCMMSKL